MAEAKFYRCEHCGAIVYVVEDKGVTPSCCGEPMTLLKANTTDGATEKHVPVVSRDGFKLTVKVGEVAHPMLPEHYIEFIALETEQGINLTRLNPGETPEAHFALPENQGGVAYEFCNLHGLWKAEF